MRCSFSSSFFPFVFLFFFDSWSAFWLEYKGAALFLFSMMRRLAFAATPVLTFPIKAGGRNNVNQKGKICLGKGNPQCLVLVGN